MTSRHPTVPVRYMWMMCCAALFAAMPIAHAQFLVDSSGSGTHTTIQAAINAASNGFEIVVAPGIYAERIDFLGKAITVTSTAPLDPTVVANTVIDGGDGGHVVTFDSGETPQAVLQGLTIRNGNATNGGGVYCVNGSSPVIQFNLIKENFCVLHGGGVHISGGASPLIYANTIEQNVCEGRGAGVYVEMSAAVVRANVIQFNMAGCSSGGGVHFDSGADSALLENNMILSNRATFGGGVEIERCAPLVQRNLIKTNIAEPRGAGISVVDGGGVFENNLIVGNRSPIAAGLEFNNSIVSVHQNTIIGNQSAQSGAILGLNGSIVSMRGNIVAFQQAVALQALAPASVDFSHGCLFTNLGGDVSGNVVLGSGNITLDPKLVSVGAWVSGGPVDGPLCGGAVRLDASLSGAGSERGDATYRFGPDRVRFAVDVRNFAPGTYDVSAASVIVGQITVNAMGDGALALDTDDGSLPPGFPILSAGDIVDVGAIVSGPLETVATSFNTVWTGGDEHLLAASPCIDVSTSGFSGVTDFDGQPRIAGALPDMGADEFTASGTGDTDGDGDIDLMDLAILQACYSQTSKGLRSPQCADTDLDGDALVTLSDWAMYASLVTGPQ